MLKRGPLDRPPGPISFPIIGHYRGFRKQPAHFLLRVAAEFGDIAYFRIGFQQMYLLNRPDLIQEVLVTAQGNFMKSRIMQRAKVLLGEGLLTSEADFHIRQRKLVQPAFYRDRLIKYSEVMASTADRVSAEWQPGQIREIDQDMMRITLGIVGETLFSVDVEGEAHEVGAALTAVLGTFNTMMLPFAGLLQKLPLPSLRKAKEAQKFLDQTIYRIIATRRESGRDHGDLLSMLLLAVDEERTGMTDRQVRDEALTLFLAGHETTATALTWTWYLLSQHPEVEARLHAELDSVLGGRLPTFEDLPKLAYTEMVFAETMRLYPPAWALGRMAIRHYRLFNHELPPKAIVIISPYVMHRHPRYYPDPERFDPERFSPEAKADRPKFTYLPFGAGPRMCIGERFAWMEGILVLATIAQRWRMRLAPRHVVDILPQITLRTRYGLKMTLEPR